jgi:tetratricopeptide (TPR) repeat protein
MNANQDTANRLLEQKDYQKALQTYLDLLQEHPNDGKIYQWIAKCYYELKKYNEAFSASNEAIKLDKNLYIPHLILAYISVDRGDLENAVLEARHAYGSSPDVEEVSNCYGGLLLST